MSNIFKAFAPITKVDDEQRMVYGYASTDSKDSQGEIVKSDAIEAALPDYMRFANIREMHTMSAVGVAKSAEVNEGGLYIGAKVVDDAAWIKVKEGVYKGFSIGGKALEKSNGVISKLRLTEISLVDRPANPECVIDTWKAEGADEQDQDGGAPSAGAGESQPTPVAEVAKAADESVEKGMYNMNRLIEALQCIKNAMSDAAYEQKYGEHSPEMLADMKAAYLALGAVAQKYLGEELNPPAKPVEMAMADGIDNVDVLKAGAMYSKATKAALSNIHKMLRDCNKAMDDMGYDKGDMDKADKGEDLSKAHVGTITADAELKKAATDAGLTVADDQPLADLAKAAVAELAKASARVAELEAQPAPAKAALTTIGKADDTKDSLAASAPSADPNDPLSMFKAALARPINMVGSPISKPSSAN
jgi:hypothetical protein